MTIKPHAQWLKPWLLLFLGGSCSMAAWAASVVVDAPGLHLNANDQATTQVQAPGVRIDASGSSTPSQRKTPSKTKVVHGTSSAQVITGDVKVDGQNVEVKNGAIVNVKTGPGSKAELNLGSKVDHSSHRHEAEAADEPEHDSDLNYVNQDLHGVNWARRALQGANMTNADLSGANLSGANLTDANLVNVNFSRANLTGAKLLRANIVNVDLTGARLDGAVWVDGRVCKTGSTGRCR